MPTKREIIAKVQGAGDAVWQEFLDFREGMKKKGIPAYQAWQIAYQMVLGGHASEEAAVMAAMDELSADNRDPKMAQSLKISQSKLLKASKARAIESRKDAATRIAVAAKAGRKLSSTAAISRMTTDGRLLTPEDFGGKDAPTVETVSWVSQNLVFDEPDVATCPCPAAYGLWAWAKANPDAFWGGVWRQMIPPRSQLSDDSAGAKKADMPIRELIDRLRGEVLEEVA